MSEINPAILRAEALAECLEREKDAYETLHADFKTLRDERDRLQKELESLSIAAGQEVAEWGAIKDNLVRQLANEQKARSKALAANARLQEELTRLKENLI